MPFNTRNPIPSGDLRDLDDNARNIDTWANDKTKLSHPDRFGVQRRTWHGIEQEAKLNIQQAIDAKNAAQEAAMMSGFSKYADTLAQLEAGIGTDYVDGDVVLVFQDEARGGTSSIYKVESGAPVFKNAFDKTRQDLLSFTGTISADAEWSDVPAHSDPAFDVQAQALANRDEFLKEQQDTLDSRLSRMVNISDYPATTIGFNSAVSDAISEDRVLRINTTVEASSIDMRNDTTQVSFVGEGKTINTYRKLVVPLRREQYVPKNTINPETQLKNLSATNSPVVVILGDSISTDGPDSHVGANSMWGVIKEKLQRDNPHKSFTFYNRAIGGQTWLTANTKPTSFPEWYTDTNVNWLNYVEALQPDVLFLAFGMNDANGFNTGAFVAVVNKIKAWAKVPDLVFITNPVPARAALYPDGAGFGFSGEVFQEGRDLVAGYERTYAHHHGHAVLDINRMFVASRDSYDVFAGPLFVAQEITENSKAAFVSEKPAIDFAVSGVCDASEFTDGRVLSFKSGPNPNDFLFVKNQGGKFQFSGYAHNNTYASKTTDVSIPVSDFYLEVSVVGGIARLCIALPDRTNQKVIAEFKVIRHGGLFASVVSWQGESSSPYLSLQFSSSYVECYKQTVTDEDVWGVSDISPNMKPVTGGNGINHYSARGIQHIVRPVIEAANFACGFSTSGVANGWAWVKRADGTSECSKRITYTGAINAANGSIFLSPELISDTSVPDIFMDSGAAFADREFNTSVTILSQAGQYIWQVSNGSSNLNNAVRIRLASAVSIESTTVDLRIRLAGRWK